MTVAQPAPPLPPPPPALLPIGAQPSSALAGTPRYICLLVAATICRSFAFRNRSAARTCRKPPHPCAHANRGASSSSTPPIGIETTPQDRRQQVAMPPGTCSASPPRPPKTPSRVDDLTPPPERDLRRDATRFDIYVA